MSATCAGLRRIPLRRVSGPLSGQRPDRLGRHGAVGLLQRFRGSEPTVRGRGRGRADPVQAGPPPPTAAGVPGTGDRRVIIMIMRSWHARGLMPHATYYFAGLFSLTRHGRTGSSAPLHYDYGQARPPGEPGRPATARILWRLRQWRLMRTLQALRDTGDK
jgi:hypothetical protein